MPSTSRREFLTVLLAAPITARLLESATDAISVAGPSGVLTFDLQTDDPEQLRYRIRFRDRVVIETSRCGIIVDGVDLGRDVRVGKAAAYDGNERYAWHGGHAVARGRFKGARIALHHTSGADYTLDVRVFDDGVAFRCIVPGEGTRVPDEATV